MDEKKLRRKKMRREIGSYGWALLIYYLLMNLCVILALVGDMVIRLLTTGDLNMMMDEASILGNGWGYLVACALAVWLIRIWKGKNFFREMWRTERLMTWKAFWKLVCLFISGQMLFQICATIQEWVLNQFGLSILESMEMATGGADTLSMFLYTALGAPVVEEIIFRGAILRGLEKYGKGFAILISSLLFGLFHGNIVQSPYAFVVGLVLGYTAMEYNILWAMVLHMVNNLVLADTLPRVTQGLGEEGAALVSYAVILACTIGGVATLFRNRKKIAAYLKEHKPSWDAWWSFAWAPGILVLMILMELNAISMLFM